MDSYNHLRILKAKNVKSITAKVLWNNRDSLLPKDLCNNTKAQSKLGKAPAIHGIDPGRDKDR